MNYDKLKHNLKEFLLEYFDYMARITEPSTEDNKINDELMYDDMILSVDIFIDIKYIVVSLTSNFGMYPKYEKINITTYIDKDKDEEALSNDVINAIKTLYSKLDDTTKRAKKILEEQNV